MVHIALSQTEFDVLSDGARSKWGWFVALGIGLLLLGAIALFNLFAATLASVLLVGALMLAGAILHIVQAFNVRNWRGFSLWLLVGLLYGAAALLILYDPVLGATALTIMLAIALVIDGCFKLAFAWHIRSAPGWGWLLASGILTALAGVLIVLFWPQTLWLLGLLLAIDLTFTGIAILFFGLMLKPRRNA